MREVCKPDEIFQKLIPYQTLQSGVLYAPSKYSLSFEHEGHHYVFNTLTRQCIEELLPSCVLAGEEYDELIRRRFLVPAKTDECAFYLSVLSLLKLNHYKKLHSAYTILPTLDCNANCVYCYQGGMQKVGMTDQTVEDSLHFVLNDCRTDTITLSWFGGEPLLRQDVIDRISQGVLDAGIEYEGLMVSNGSLITPKLVEKMTELWRLKKIQISMDGAETDYISRKRYHRYRDYYNTVIDSICRMSDAGISVRVRCNIDQQNVERIPRFIDELASCTKNKKSVNIYLSPLYQVMESEHDLELWENLVSLQDVITQSGFDITYNYFSPSLPAYRCMADAGGIVIAPDGSLHCCEDLPTGSKIGHVTCGVVDMAARKTFARMDKPREKCRECMFLPDCTPFASCPKIMNHCRETRMMLTLDALKRMVKTAYSDYNT